MSNSTLLPPNVHLRGKLDPWRQIGDRILAYNLPSGFEFGHLLEPLPQEVAVYKNAFISQREILNSTARRGHPLTVAGLDIRGPDQRVSRGAIYDHQGRIIPEFERLSATGRFDNPATIPLSRRQAATRVPGACIYLGTLHGHFGHFLIESLARAWVLLRQNDTDRVIFHDSNYARATRHALFVDPKQLNLPRYISVIFDALGIGAGQLALANRDLLVDELLIPTSQFHIYDVASIGMCEPYDRIRDVLTRRLGVHSGPGPSRKLYLTRRQFAAHDPQKRIKSIANEDAIERLFVARGFRIVAPEQLQLEEQIALISNATHIAGTTGSALHMMLFNNQPQTQVIALDWRKSKTQYVLEAARGVSALHIYCFDGRDDCGSPVANLGIIEDALSEWRPPTAPPSGEEVSALHSKSRAPAANTARESPSPMDSFVPNKQVSAEIAVVSKETHSVRRVNRIARHVGARSYLEIGVFKGKTFNNLEFEEKVGVDPHFAFDTKLYEKGGVEFVSDTSDAFFLSVGTSRHFDVIFLDGLHTFQQTFRDFCNSLACSHDRTVWLLDDVVPNDVYSAWPIAAEAREYRRRAGLSGLAWHGDVFKMLFAIHDFFPTMSYVTLGSRGNPQAIVWKAPRPNFSPALGSLEAVDRLSYFDMLRHESLLNLLPEEEAFDFFFASMPRAPA